MADDDDSVESKSSSLGIITDILSSFTSIGTSNSDPEDDQTDTKHAEKGQQESLSDTNYTDVEPEGVADDDGNGERRQSSLEKISDFFSSFTSSPDSKTDDEADVETFPSSQDQDSSDSSDKNTSELDSGEIAEDNADEERRQSSLGKISDFLSSFTSLGNSSAETTMAEVDNQTNQNIDIAQEKDEYLENEDVIIEDDESEGPNSSEGRMRSSSSRIYTEPETIDKKDLDYITLVSS